MPPCKRVKTDEDPLPPCKRTDDDPLPPRKRTEDDPLPPCKRVKTEDDRWAADMMALVRPDAASDLAAPASVADVRARCASMSDVDLRRMVSRAFRELPGDRVRDLYSATVRVGGFDRVVDAVHAHAKEGLLAGRVQIQELLRQFDCHPTLTLAVVAPLAQEGVEATERERVEAVENGDLESREIVDRIGGLEPGQAVLIVCDGIVDSEDSEDSSSARMDRFESGAIICRIPPNRTFPPFPPIDKLRLRKREMLAYAGLTAAAYAGLADADRASVKERALRAAREERRYKNAWRSIEIDPPLVPGGKTGLWLRWFIASQRVQTAPDGEFDAAFVERMQNAGLCGDEARLGSAEYLVMSFPSSCGAGNEVSMEITNPDAWTDEAYSYNDGDFDIVDEPDAFAEEAWFCATLEEAVDRVYKDTTTTELIVKASRPGQPADVLYRSKHVDPETEYIAVG